MLKKTLITFVLLFSGLISTGVNANNISYELEVDLLGAETFPPAPTGSWGKVDQAELWGLPQFDPMIGTLTSATLLIGGILVNDVFLMADSVIDSNLENSIEVNSIVAVTAEVPINSSSGVLVRPWESLAGQAQCAGSGEVPCMDSNFTVDDLDISGIFTGAEMEAFIGTGTLEDITINLFIALDSFDSVNLVDPSADVLADFSGLVTVAYEYTTSPVPIPAALPLFGSALGLMGLLGWRKRKHA